LTLRLTNTLTRRSETFEPLVPGRVSIYCCGVTVYDLCHLGHARSYIVWDVLRRYLIWRGFAVTFVQNFTDIDDKILNRAAEEGSSMEEVSERNIALYWEDMDRLNILRPDRTPRATRSLEAIRSLIGELEAKGAAYSADGDVYFAVMKASGYGKLSGRDPAEQIEGASGRVAGAEANRKHHPFDFALWKAAKPGEPSFPSPWGPGRPGWHIECSAMAEKYLGVEFWIHGGGLDLVFPHHENEIAQSRAVGRPFARLWMHNGMLRFTGEKMSKSVGNVATIREVLDEWGREATLVYFLTAHWRKPIDFSAETMAAAAARAEGLRNAFRGDSAESGPGEWERFAAALDDDFNTPDALAVLGEWRAAGYLGLLRRGLTVFGLGSLADEEEAPPEVVELAEARRAARAASDYAEADRLRAEIEAEGWEVRDEAGGVRLVRPS
jgi:cysteinyl-tRNA synthetase